MRSRTACTSSGVTSWTPWWAAAWPATWARMPFSSAAENRALQPGMTSPQAKVFIVDSLSGAGWSARATVARESAGLLRVPRGGEVLDAQQAEDGAGRVGAEHRVEALGRRAGERALQGLGDTGRGVHPQRHGSPVGLAGPQVAQQQLERLAERADQDGGRRLVDLTGCVDLAYRAHQAGDALGELDPGGVALD